MKQIIITLIIALGFLSCNDGNSLTPQNNSGYINAKLDGVLLETNFTLGDRGENDENVLWLGGSDNEPPYAGNTKTLALTITFGEEIVAGTFEMDGSCIDFHPNCTMISYQITDDKLNVLKNYKNGGFRDSTSSATINFAILEYKKNGRCKGTFSGKINGEGKTIIVTDGNFDVVIE